MKIRKIEMEGFCTFKDYQYVDFTEYEADGLFLIAGETGAGKSTILDAIVFALYGSTPRWVDSNALQSKQQIRSDFCGPDDPSRVVLHFEANNREIRITRTPAYEYVTASGTLKDKDSTVLIEEFQKSKWVAVATKKNEAGEFVKSLIKLTREEFLQVILLAQGRFADFLKANSNERRDLLGKLFDIRRFTQYINILQDRTKKLYGQKRDKEKSLETTLQNLLTEYKSESEPMEGEESAWVDSLISAAEENLAKSQKSQKQAKKSHEEALKSLEIAKNQQKLKEAKSKLDELLKQEKEIKNLAEQVAVAERAARVKPLIEAVEKARDKAKDQLKKVEAARSDYKGKSKDNQLEKELNELTEEIGKLSELLVDEANLITAQKKLPEAENKSEELKKSITSTKEDIQKLLSEREVQAALTVRPDDLEEKKDRLKKQIEAVNSLANIKSKIKDAEKSLNESEVNLQVAKKKHRDLLDKFIKGYAAKLAEELKDGEACSVCGSKNHPKRAEWSGERIDDEQVSAARDEEEKREHACTKAREVLAQIKQEASALDAFKGDAGLDVIQKQFDEVIVEIEKSKIATSRVKEIDSQIGKDGKLQKKLDDFEKKSASALEEVSGLRAEIDTLEKKLKKLAGDSSSVSSKKEALEEKRTEVKTLLDALQLLDTANNSAEEAENNLKSALRDENFESEEFAKASILDKASIQSSNKKIKDYQEEVARQQGIIDQKDLQELPKKIIDLEEVSARVENLSIEIEKCIKEEAVYDQQIKSLGNTKETIKELSASIMELDSEYYIVNRLSNSFKGEAPNVMHISLDTYFVAAELESVLEAANQTLRRMTSNRYTLKHTVKGLGKSDAASGLEIQVMDEHTGKARDPYSLSGGETFLSSLALALGLAEVVTSRAGGIELNTLFIDEGFGTLSPEFLEMAMQTLDSLKQGGRTIGVISHVESMKERIGAQVKVVRRAGSSSEIKH
jgi:exonuclease SbcC